MTGTGRGLQAGRTDGGGANQERQRQGRQHGRASRHRHAVGSQLVWGLQTVQRAVEAGRESEREPP